MDFKLVADFQPTGDQPQAIAALVANLRQGSKHNVLLGVTGSGKTYTMANVITQLQRPTLVIAHNKTLAAQLCSEFRSFFPNNAVEYFVSYYDYYQPEAYLPARDIYIEKEADINEEIERLRHSATRALMTRRDVILVASVSCIYGLGVPEDYAKGIISLKTGQQLARHAFLLQLEHIQYERNDVELKAGRYRIKGETVDIFPSWEEHVLRLEFFGDEIERMYLMHPVSGEMVSQLADFDLFPATHYLVHERQEEAAAEIRQEMTARVQALQAEGRLVEAQRLEKRTKYDLEMMLEMGYCKGIENYARYLSGREPGSPPGVLLDFFPKDFLTIIDEGHVTLPQIRGMSEGDRSRKKILIDYGFRLPSAGDNRPLKFAEFEAKVGQCVYVSATPGPYELEKAHWPDGRTTIVEQIIRPTGLVDPVVVIKPTKGQVDDLLTEIHRRVACSERVLITTLTKRMAEDLSAFLEEKGVKARYLHSEIHSLDRLDILHDLRAAKFDVLIGVNLLREGLDLPEVSLVAIMDADKEGFLRNERSLIQIIGRAARNINGSVILYADKLTNSINGAVAESNRRRKIQLAYNQTHNIQPRSIVKKISDIRSAERESLKNILAVKDKVSPREFPKLIAQLQKDMKAAAKNLEFELAAVLRDQIEELKTKDFL